MNNISVSNIRIRPFSDENPLEFNPRTINDDFTYRSDFILFDNLNRLGIVFEAENTAFGQPLHEPRAHCYEVQLVDDEAHELVALSYVSIRLSAWEESEYVYTELSIDPSFITVGRTYRIVVVRKGSSQELCSKNLRFLRPSKLYSFCFDTFMGEMFEPHDIVYAAI